MHGAAHCYVAAYIHCAVAMIWLLGLPVLLGCCRFINGVSRALLLLISSLRHSMQYFVDTLMYHLQVDVIESQFQATKRKMEESKVRGRRGAWSVLNGDAHISHVLLFRFTCVGFRKCSSSTRRISEHADYAVLPER